MKDNSKDEPQTDAIYPGDTAEALEIIDLAEAYRMAAETLFEHGQKGQRLTYAPARFCAIHATELYLNAFLRHQGEQNCDIRARRHNIDDSEFVKTLKLRKKTGQHLTEMTERREYLISRYAPDLASQHTELNRLQATLKEVSEKMACFMRD